MKRLITVAMAFGIICIAAPLACAQTMQYIGQCPPGNPGPVCVDIKDNGAAKEYTLPATPTGPAEAIAQCRPGERREDCVAIHGKGASKAAWAYPENQSKDPEMAIGECRPGERREDCVALHGRGASKAAWATPDNHKSGTSLAEWLKAKETRKAQKTSPVQYQAGGE